MDLIQYPAYPTRKNTTATMVNIETNSYAIYLRNDLSILLHRIEIVPEIAGDSRELRGKIIRQCRADMTDTLRSSFITRGQTAYSVGEPDFLLENEPIKKSCIDSDAPTVAPPVYEARTTVNETEYTLAFHPKDVIEKERIREFTLFYNVLVK